jgi:hypothetical protein
VYRSIDELQTNLDLWAATSGTLVLRQRPSWTPTYREGENDRSLTTSDTKPNRSSRLLLSDRVPAHKLKVE